MNDDLDKERQERWAKWGIEPVEALNEHDDRLDLERFFRDLISAYVNFPRGLKVEFKEALRCWALMVEPDVSDYAIVAGKLGRNFNALKVLVTGIGEAQGLEIELSLEGPRKDDPRYIRKFMKYRANPQWNANALKNIVRRTLQLAGIDNVKLMLQKNRVVDELNPFNDQTFFWFVGTERRQTEFVFALGQLMESMGIAQGQRLTPKPRTEIPFEKTA